MPEKPKTDAPAQADPGRVTLTRDGGVAILTLDCTSKRNAFTPAIKAELTEHLAASIAAPDVRAIVITGAAGHFSAGGDITGMMSLKGGHDGRDSLLKLHRITRMIVECEKPVIAAVEGACAGGGMALAASCDIVIAGEGAKFSCGFHKIGLMPDMGAVWTLPMRMGFGRAKMFMLIGDPITAQEALRDGLAEKVVPTGEALTAAMEIAGKMSTAATRALGFTKSVLARMPAGLDAMLKTEADAQLGLMISDDFLEGRTAFLEKRAPKFTGR